MKQKKSLLALVISVVVGAVLMMGCPKPIDLPADKVVTIAAIAGVTAPVLGATPVTTITETEQYTGTVAWCPTVSGTFAANTVYTATITLTAKTGYTLTGVTENFFKVAEATTTNGANSGVVTAVFPKTISDNANLSDLTVSSGTLSPDFSPAVTAYSVSVPNETTSIIVTGTKADSNASVSSNNGVAQALSVGANTITITVTAQDGITTKNYVVTVTRSYDYVSANIGTLKYVPAGRFQRDGNAANISVITKAYRISQYEITRAQFLVIMETDPSNATFSSGNTDPVQMVNWYHAIAFCNKLSIAEELTPVYSVSGVNFATLTYADIPTSSNADWNAATADWNANGYRLPTEMEWMWAAMGAPADGQGGVTNNTTGYLKAFAGSTGNNAIGDYAVFGYYDSETGRTTTERSNPVGSKTANELGLYDMSGNVWEWCWDWHAAYPTGTLTDYLGAASGFARVNRGGSWNGLASICAVAYRYISIPSYQGIFFGFRVVRK